MKLKGLVPVLGLVLVQQSLDVQGLIPALFPFCSFDNTINGNETDVDCGGPFCPKCTEELQTCKVNEDCDLDEAGCANGQCFEMKFALRDSTIILYYMIGTLVLMTSFVACECRARVKGAYSRYKRRSQKSAQEAKRKKEEEIQAEVEEAERNERRHSAVLKAMMAKLEQDGELDDAELDNVSSDEDEEGAVPVAPVVTTKKSRPGLMKKMVSTMFSKSTNMNQLGVISEDAKVDPDGGDEGDVKDLEAVPAQLSEAEKAVKRERKKQKKLQKLLAKMESNSPEQEAIRLRQLFLAPLTDLHNKTKEHVSQIRKDAAIINVNTRLLKEERGTAVSKLRVLTLVMLKPGCLINMTLDEVKHAIVETERAEGLIGEVLKSDGKDVEKDTEKLQEAVNILEEIAETVGSPIESDYFSNALEVMDWELGDSDLAKLQFEVETELETKKKRKEKLREKVMLANTSFVSAVNINKVVKKKNRCRNFFLSLATLIFPRVFFIYPLFYLVFFFGMAIAGVKFFFGWLGGEIESNADLQASGLLGSTFLPVPPYYDLDNREGQRFFVPLLYWIMHMALYVFCWIPVPFWRGFWRDFSFGVPKIRQYIPIDDFVFLHKLLGVLILTYLFVGGVFFMSAMRAPCVNERDPKACLAFDPLPPKGFEDQIDTFAFNPFLNVLMLRKIVFTLWFPIYPMLHFARGSPNKWLPGPVKRYFYEIAYYLHIIVAHVSLWIALISRFDVFYPALFTWGIYYLDNIREIFFKSYDTTVVIRPTFANQEDDADNEKSSVIHTNERGLPTSIKLLLEVPFGFKINAGQYIYVKVPSISHIQYHPFSLASGSTDNHVELQIGVIGQKDQWKQDENGEWKMIKRPTFTYKLQNLLRKRILKMAGFDDPERQIDQLEPIKVRIRGPYGSVFTKCFDPHYHGCIIIGAGTGLTAALSVLRELLIRKRRGDRVPKYCFFVWSCANVSDLLWMWEQLHTLILDAVKDDIIKPGKKWSRSSNMLGWLGVTIYVTRANKKLLRDFVAKPIVTGENKLKSSKSKTNANKFMSSKSSQSSKDEKEEKAAAELAAKEVPSSGKERTVHLGQLRNLWVSSNTNIRRITLEKEIHHWLGHERRLLAASMDDESTHIRKLLAWTRVYVDRKASKAKKLTCCFCGPSSLAHTISAASSALGTSMEFSADHQ